MRRAQTAHAPALLIYKNERVTAHAVTQAGAKRAHLLRRFHIARKKDKPPRVRIPKEGFFTAAQPRTREAKYRGERAQTGLPFCHKASLAARFKLRAKPVCSLFIGEASNTEAVKYTFIRQINSGNIRVKPRHHFI